MLLLLMGFVLLHSWLFCVGTVVCACGFADPVLSVVQVTFLFGTV